MVRHHQEIQRRFDLHPRLVIGMDGRQTAGIAECGLRVGAQVVVGKRIRRVGGVQVGVTPQQLLLRESRCGERDRQCGGQVASVHWRCSFVMLS